MRKAALWFLACAALGACGGAPDSPLFGDGGGGGDGGVGVDGSSEGGPNCDLSKCPSIPNGFALVRLGEGKGSCPSGWGSSDVVTNPTVSDGACTCDCGITQQPTCDTGDIYRGYDDYTTATCGTAGATFPANQGACSQTGQAINLNHVHYAVDPPLPSGGACSYQAKVDETKLGSTAATLCAPPQSCAADACVGQVCIAGDGDQTCPSAFPNKTLVGTSATADCSDCGTCTVGGTCTGKMAFFTDTNCTTGEDDFTADAVCRSTTASGTSYYYSYMFTGSLVSATCGTATSTATPGLDGKKTICCQ